MIDLTPIAAIGTEVLPGFFGPSARSVSELRPRDEVIDRVFQPEAAAVARDAYGSLWAALPNLPPPPAGTVPLVNAALAEDFAAGNARARPFANGYREIAARLRPGVMWLVLRFVKPGATTGLAFDGFVYLGDRAFAWFPKPWRALGTSGEMWKHWSD